MTECNCLECRLAQEHGDVGQIPESEILQAGGCPYCAMAGYEDYPMNQKPCRVPGHVAIHEKNVASAQLMLEANRHPWKAGDGPCPYCKVNETCKHWTGLGWGRDWENGYKRLAFEST